MVRAYPPATADPVLLHRLLGSWACRDIAIRPGISDVELCGRIDLWSAAVPDALLDLLRTLAITNLTPALRRDNSQVLFLWTSKLIPGVELPARHIDVTRGRMAGYRGSGCLPTPGRVRQEARRPYRERFRRQVVV